MQSFSYPLAKIVLSYCEAFFCTGFHAISTKSVSHIFNFTLDEYTFLFIQFQINCFTLFQYLLLSCSRLCIIYATDPMYFHIETLLLHPIAHGKLSKDMLSLTENNLPDTLCTSKQNVSYHLSSRYKYIPFSEFVINKTFKKMKSHP